MEGIEKSYPITPPPSADHVCSDYKRRLLLMVRLISEAGLSLKLTSAIVDSVEHQNGQFAKISLVVGLPSDILDVLGVPAKYNVDTHKILVIS